MTQETSCHQILGGGELAQTEIERHPQPRLTHGVGEVALCDLAQQTIIEWTNRVLTSSRSPENPYAMGFVRNHEGKIITIYGPKTFENARAFLPEQGVICAETRREIFLLPPTELRVSNPSLLKGRYWKHLPERLKQTLVDGKILVTSAADYYPSPEKGEQFGEYILPGIDDIDLMSKSNPDLDKWAILFTAEHKRHNGNGRTGVLVKIGDKGVEPVRVEIAGQEYIVELKGCGTTAGGFGKSHERTGREIITGGCEAQQAVDEVNELDRSSTFAGAKAGAALVFDNRDFTPYLSNGNGVYKQGYIVRLSPSTLRASFSGMESYPDVYDSEHARAVMTMFTRGFLGAITAESPSILDRSSHSENIALWGEGQYEITDFSDHVALNHPRYPHQENWGGFMTVRTMLHYHLGMMAEIPGFVKAGGYRTLAKIFIRECTEAGIEGFDALKDPGQDSIGSTLWSKILAKRVFEARSEYGY